VVAAADAAGDGVEVLVEHAPTRITTTARAAVIRSLLVMFSSCNVP
jgi:hypothetical protein